MLGDHMALAIELGLVLRGSLDDLYEVCLWGVVRETAALRRDYATFSLPTFATWRSDRKVLGLFSLQKRKICPRSYPGLLVLSGKNLGGDTALFRN